MGSKAYRAERERKGSRMMDGMRDVRSEGADAASDTDRLTREMMELVEKSSENNAEIKRMGAGSTGLENADAGLVRDCVSLHDWASGLLGAAMVSDGMAARFLGTNAVPFAGASLTEAARSSDSGQVNAINDVMNVLADMRNFFGNIAGQRQGQQEGVSGQFDLGSKEYRNGFEKTMDDLLSALGVLYKKVNGEDDPNRDNRGDSKFKDERSGEIDDTRRVRDANENKDYSSIAAEGLRLIFTKEVINDWNYMSIEEKSDCINSFVKFLGESMQIDVNRVVVKDLGPDVAGVMYGSQGYMELSIDYFYDSQYLGFILQTVMHEMRHKQQFDACFTDKDFGIEQETLNTWAWNYYNYITLEDDFEGYMKQPIERDARDFAEETMIKAGLGLNVWDFDRNRWIATSTGIEG
ncbi:MAG: hypothetical protein FWE70_08225 [Oscillospiraceae bacterium]|nr:hypothetical protein [Oscillospiraceae bacterium]